MNYESFFELKDKPFRQGPDTDYFYSSNIHKELLHHLHYCIESDDAFVEITGDPGIGKTITVRSFLSQIAGDKVKLSLIVNPKISPQDLLVSIALDCGMDEDIVENNSGERLFRFFQEHLKKLNQQKIVPIVIIDEAHSLSNEALEYLCLISNLESKRIHLIKTILLGQSLLHQRLQDPVLKQIDNRITIRFHLTPLTKNDMANYIYHRLAIASESGSPPSLFSKQNIDHIFRYSHGVPRLVNVICDRTLMAAFSENTREITSNHVKKAYRSFQNNQKIPGHVIKKRIVVVSVVLFFLFACIYMTTRSIHSPEALENNPDPGIPIQIYKMAQKSQPNEGHAIAITQTESSQTKMAAHDAKSNEITMREKSIEPVKKVPEKLENQSIQTGQSMNLDQLPIKKLFTKNSYCIVVSPDINRMVVWQGKPDFSGLTSTLSDSLQLEEGVYFLDQKMSETKEYSSTTGDSLTTMQTIISEPIENTENLTHTQIIENPKDLTQTRMVDNFKKPTQTVDNFKKLTQTQAQSKSSMPKSISEINEQPIQSPNQSDKTTVSKSKDKLPQKVEHKSEENNLLKQKESVLEPQKEQLKTTDIKKQAAQIKTPQASFESKDKKTNQPYKKDNNLQSIMSLPSDKRLAMISLDVNQLTVWKGTNDRPKLINQEKIDLVVPEGIYILSKTKDKHFLFHPDIQKKLPEKSVDELWKKIDPITNVIPVIALKSHQKHFHKETKSILTFVNQWEYAWRQKDLDAYMQMYVNNTIYFYKLNAPPIKLNWKILKSSQSRIFSGNRNKLMHISPTTYLIDPQNSNFAVALFNQTFTDANYSEISMMVLYLKYSAIKNTNQKKWRIYGRMRIY